MFNLTNLVDTKTCVTNSHKSTIDLILTNKPSSFQKAMATKTGLSDFHKLVSTLFKSHYSRLKPKIVYYRDYSMHLRRLTFVLTESVICVTVNWVFRNSSGQGFVSLSRKKTKTFCSIQ